MDIAALVLSTITATVSAIAAILTYLNGKKTAYGNIELQIRSMISEAKYHQIQFAEKLSYDSENEYAKRQFAALNEELLNAYDEACAKYLDGKVDKERFRKMYFHEIKQLVECDNYSNEYDKVSSRYIATIKVYQEWVNLEK